MARISEALRKRVVRFANNRCEYCLTSQEMTLATFHVDHIIPKSLNGSTFIGNLCLSCPFCNQFKKNQVRARDPITGKTVALFNPRSEEWHEHFVWNKDGTLVLGRTAIGRATITALRMNHPIALIARRYWVSSGIHPPEN